MQIAFGTGRVTSFGTPVVTGVSASSPWQSLTDDAIQEDWGGGYYEVLQDHLTKTPTEVGPVRAELVTAREASASTEARDVLFVLNDPALALTEVFDAAMEFACAQWRKFVLSLDGFSRRAGDQDVVIAAFMVALADMRERYAQDDRNSQTVLTLAWTTPPTMLASPRE